MNSSSTVAITGNTYPVREQLAALGGRWNPTTKAWMVPAARAAEAQALVKTAPVSVRPSYGSSSRPMVTCGYCGGRYQRGGLCPRCGDEG